MMTSSTNGKPPTAYEMNRAAAYLAATRDQVSEAVKELSTEQWNFQPGPDCWCIAEVIEHIAIIEGRIHLILARLPEAELAEPERDDAAIDAIVAERVPKRTERIPAPPLAQPKRECTPDEALRDFLDKRNETLRLLESENIFLRGRVIPHPVLGNWDGYQWILAAAAHSDRHLDQIREIRQSPLFPQSFSSVV